MNFLSNNKDNSLGDIVFNCENKCKSLDCPSCPSCPGCDSCCEEPPACDSCCKECPNCDSCCKEPPACDSCCKEPPACDSCCAPCPSCDSCCPLSIPCTFSRICPIGIEFKRDFSIEEDIFAVYNSCNILCNKTDLDNEQTLSNALYQCYNCIDEAIKNIDLTWDLECRPFT